MADGSPLPLSIPLVSVRRSRAGEPVITPPSAGFLPLVRDLPAGLTSVDVFKRLVALPYCIWFDSAAEPDGLGRYSFLSADPVQVFRCGSETADPLALLQPTLQLLRQEGRHDLPPFQGGLAGVIGYELAHALEHFPRAAFNDLPTGELCFGLYDWVVAQDHLTGRGWIISQGFPETTVEGRRRRAAERLDQVMAWLGQQPAVLPSTAAPTASLAAPQFATHIPGITSNFTRDGYCAGVDHVRQAIRRGDCFQVNLAQRMVAHQSEPAPLTALRLRQSNPAPMAGYFDAGTWQLVSASPERFVRTVGSTVETRPIKGTVPRTGDAERDAALAARLLASEKDLAENVMIVDLMRNDLSRVCRDDSIRVTELCQLRRYAYVQHLVSTVVGELRPESSALDLIRASFPGGSITGAPKIQAMRMIAQLEGVCRGAYCGSLGYFSTGGRSDFSILIRTVTLTGGYCTFSVGGGVTAASEPAAEYQETWDKANGILQALSGAAGCYW